MHEPSDPVQPVPRDPQRGVDPAVKNGAVFTDSRVEIEIDDETGRPQLRIVSGARPKT